MSYARLIKYIANRPIHKLSQPLMRNNVLGVIILIVKVY